MENVQCAIGGIAQPALDQRLVHLQMELEAVGVLAVTEGLLLAAGGARQVRRLARYLEAVTVPLEHRRRGAERRQDGIFATGCSIGSGIDASSLRMSPSDRARASG